MFKSTLSISLGFLLALLGCVAAADEQAELSDVGARVQYAYFVADNEALQQALQQLKMLSVADALAAVQQEYLAYGHWKLAELNFEVDKLEAARAAEHCAEVAQPKKNSGRYTAELQALQAICLHVLVQLRPLRGIFYQRQRDKVMKKALRTRIHNPRVLLIQALLHEDELLSAKVSNTSRQQLLNTIDTFNAEIPAPGQPDWGYAEALRLLGAHELRQGNQLAARNALEQALVVAPDYQRVQKMLGTMTGF